MSWFSSGAFEKRYCIPSETWSTGRNANASIIQQKCLTSLLSRYDCARPKSWIFLHLCFKYPRTSIWGPRTFVTAFIAASSKSVDQRWRLGRRIVALPREEAPRTGLGFYLGQQKHLTIWCIDHLYREVERILHLPLVCWQSTIIIHCSSFRLLLLSSCTQWDECTMGR